METNTVQQESAMKIEPQQEHQWLTKLVGEWTYEIEVEQEDSPQKATGTENVRSRLNPKAQNRDWETMG